MWPGNARRPIRTPLNGLTYAEAGAIPDVLRTWCELAMDGGGRGAQWKKKGGGRNRTRTCDLLRVKQMLSQLSYSPTRWCAACRSEKRQRNKNAVSHNEQNGRKRRVGQREQDIAQDDRHHRGPEYFPFETVGSRTRHCYLPTRAGYYATTHGPLCQSERSPSSASLSRPLRRPSGSRTTRRNPAARTAASISRHRSAARAWSRTGSSTRALSP